MCGIAGIVTPRAQPSAETVRRMVAAMSHRGPDAAHFWNAGEAALGMRRLAIVDVDGGVQPLRNETGTVQVVYNGEIYNHAELRVDLLKRGHTVHTLSDGAVIPHLYEEFGTELFSRLSGIFAVALWDAVRQTLLLARDHLGVKPLYVHRRGNEVRFASEIKALLEDSAVPRRLDLDALDQHLTFRFTPAPRTLLDGIEKLEPGTVRVCRDGLTHTERFWRSEASAPADLSFADATEVFRDELRGAVHRQMMSDRPIGVMLSGGLDSAAIVALMAERSTQVKTFTVGFEDGGDADERDLARRTAELFDTDHHDLVLSGADFEAELPMAIEMLEEPVATSSALGFRAVSRLARGQVPVLLSGQGADELLAGYWRYVGEWLAGMAFGLPRPLSSLVPKVASASRHMHSARAERGLRALSNPETLSRFMDIYAVFTTAQKQELYGTDLAEVHRRSDWCSPSDPVERFRREVSSRSALAQMMYVDLRLWLPDDLLLVGDKMSMAESVEMRVPFLDRQLVDFVESLPSSYKIRRGQRKAIEKAALEPLLPREIIHRKERGFVTPLDRWLRTDMQTYARTLLLAPEAHSARLFRRAAIERLLRRHLDGAFDHTRQLFCLLSFELWARRFLGS